MKRLVCCGCGAGENLENPTGDIHTVQLMDLFPLYSEIGKPDKPVQEDLCERCRNKIRREFFGIEDTVLLDMPLMKGA